MIRKYWSDFFTEMDDEAEAVYENIVGAATGVNDVRGVAADRAHLIDWASGKGPETDLGKRAMKKKKKIVRRKLNGVSKV